MALTKSRSSAITQLTANGQSTAKDLTGAYRASFQVKHVTGSGTITAGGIVIVQVRDAVGSGDWFDFVTRQFGTTASTTETWVVPLPDDSSETRLSWTVPAGSTGHTLDGLVSTITAY